MMRLLPIALSMAGRGVEGGGNLTNVHCKAIQN
jgi:hypothetical protein